MAALMMIVIFFMNNLSLSLSNIITGNTFIASQNQQLYNYTIDCIADEDCIIQCINASCALSTVSCPHDHGSYCNITCIGYYACDSMNVNWSSSIPSLHCEGVFPCWGVFYPLFSDDTTPFLVNCDLPMQCYGLLITCPKHARCDILCIAERSCDFAIVSCPLDAECNFVCNGSYSCRYLHAKWSSIPGLGSLSCNGEEACKGVWFPPPDPDTPTLITCDNIEECQQARIECPTNADCTIQCIADRACYHANIIWPSLPALGTLLCDGESSCSTSNFPPQPPNVPYTVKCNETSKCLDSTILCPANADCIIQCIGPRSCSGAEIIWPTNRSVTAELQCTIDFEDDTAECYFTTPEPRYLTPDNSTDYTLNCVTDQQCANYVVDCPINGGCYVSCNATGACQGMIVNWVDGQPNDLFCGDFSSACRGIHFKPYNQSVDFVAHCTGSWACAGAIITCPSDADCTILCANSHACRSAVINGPFNHRLNVVCTGGCFLTTIHAESVSYFELNCTTVNSCIGITIYFPPNSLGIPLNTIRVVQGIQKGTFYALNGYEDVNVISSEIDPWDTWTAWGMDASTMYCNVDFVQAGDIENCEHPVLPSTDPTIQPSDDPTSNPTSGVIDALSIVLESNSSQDVCSNGHSNYLDGRYKINTGMNSCIDGVIPFISYLIDIIDVLYSESKLVVRSNITKETRSQLQVLNGSMFCGNITLDIISCFDSMETKAEDLLNQTKSMIRGINQRIINNSKYINTTIVIYLHNTTIKYIDKVDGPSPWYTEYKFYIAICVLVVYISIVVAVWCVKKQRRRDRAKQSLLVKNPMVILIAIGDYDHNAANRAAELRDCHLRDLPVDKDVDNLIALFGVNTLNYKIYPQYKDSDKPKTQWTLSEILHLLNTKARELNANSEYDGLFVAVSSHGIEGGYICTSDYKLLSKLAVHRLFTTNYAKVREIPRVFLFDCCEGNEQRDGFFEEEDVKSKDKEEQDDARKLDVEEVIDKEMNQMTCFKESDIERGDVVWGVNTRSVDYRLVTINAANPGYQSKLNIKIGSYMICGFIDRMCQDLGANNGENARFIAEIMDEVQQELEQKGKQHIVATYRDFTRFIRFKKSDKVHNIRKRKRKQLNTHDANKSSSDKTKKKKKKSKASTTKKKKASTSTSKKKKSSKKRDKRPTRRKQTTQ
eukprot:786576_1